MTFTADVPDVDIFFRLQAGNVQRTGSGSVVFNSLNPTPVEATIDAGVGSNTFTGQKLLSLTIQWEHDNSPNECTFQARALLQEA